MDLTGAFNAALAVAIVAAVLGVAVSHDVSSLLAPLRWGVRLGGLLLVNLLVIPGFAVLVARGLPLASHEQVAIVLAAAGAGGAGSIKACQLARIANLPLALSGVLLLQLLNLLVLPAWVATVLDHAELPQIAVVRGIGVLIVAPLAVGVLVRRRWPDRAGRWGVPLDRLGTLALVGAILLALVGGWKDLVIALASAVPLAAVLIIAVAAALGALVCWPDRSRRITAGLVSAMRFAAFGLLLISLNLGADSPVMAPALAFALIELVLVAVAAAVVGFRVGHPAERVVSAG